MHHPIAQAAEYLIGLRNSGQAGPRLPEEWRPKDCDEALAIQQEVTRRLGWKIAGWKCSVGGEGRIPVAPLYAPLVYRESPCPSGDHRGMAQIEPEVAFVIGRDVAPGNPSEDEILAAISEVRLVLELIGSRYEDPATPFAEKLADCISNEGFYTGVAIDVDPRDVPGAFTVEVEGLPRIDGKHPDGHPLAPLRWLAAYRGLKAGDIVTTGSYAGIVKVPLGVPMRVGFGELGTLAVAFQSPMRSNLR